MTFSILIYNSVLRTILTIPKLEPEINSLDDVIKNNIETIYVDFPAFFIPFRYEGVVTDKILEKAIQLAMTLRLL